MWTHQKFTRTEPTGLPRLGNVKTQSQHISVKHMQVKFCFQIP